MRRLRVCFANTMPGRLGSPSGPTTWLCRQRLDEDRMKAGKSRRIRARRARPDPEVRSSRPKSPQWSAARRCASGEPFASQADAGSETTHLRLAALHAPHVSKGRTKSSPRAWRESDCVCANGCVNESGCLIIESEPAHRKDTSSHPVIPGRVLLDAGPESSLSVIMDSGFARKAARAPE